MKPRRITIEIHLDTRAFTSALTRLRQSLRGHTPTSIMRAAIERYDIPESDIRRIDGYTVVLWNRRRITIDPARVP